MLENQIQTQRETCDWVEIPHKLNQGSIKSKNSREVMHYVATLDSCIVSSDIILFAQIVAEYEHVSNISKILKIFFQNICKRSTYPQLNTQLNVCCSY